MNLRTHPVVCFAAMLTIPTVQAGPYSAGLDDRANSYDAPVPGFVGPHGVGKARIDDGTGQFQNPNNRVNPLFFAWASNCSSYERSDTDAGFNEPEYALGPVTGDNFDVVSLGDLTAAQITTGNPAGRITLKFTKPIRNLSGADFVIFENGFISGFNTGGSGSGGVYAELAYVEVSADGVNFVRFNPVSLTPSAVGAYGTINPTNVYNLAGKHVNAYGDCWGTPFDIGQTGLSEISHIRLVDVPGSGAYKDGGNRSIFDSWRTFGSGGFDLEAVGSISTPMTFGQWPLLAELPANMRTTTADPDNDGIPNLMEYAFGLLPWEKNPKGTGWRCQTITVGAESFYEFTTLRDERCMDLVRDLQVSSDLKIWTTLARSTAGGVFLPQNGFTPLISDQRVGDLASVGVMREDRIRDTRPVSESAKRFYRLSITRPTP
ncbi:hypothetical protein JIN84_13580 [Luteolibacter yonseiensis]|uniref:Uncharacterized protein n=1 Tax=Luteolibacter yonseiensis TaxID=1144680 RepID=A0A934VC67_9BACT|nr:hypothetical protein [Luteolibacter yonseiensis]MBK1816651.1 hypothetical protein [Luteolibacter yonseiensis]